MRKTDTRGLTLAAVIAALYAVLTLTLPIPQYGGVQLRAAEAMTVLPRIPSLRRRMLPEHLPRQ